MGQNLRNAYCRNLDEDLRMPNKEEAFALFYNKMLIDHGNSANLWTSTLDSGSGRIMAFALNSISGCLLLVGNLSAGYSVVCIKRN